MFEFHVAITKTDAPLADPEDTRVTWQSIDGARASFELARDHVDNVVTEGAENGWTLDCVSIWPSDDEDAQLASVSEHELSLVTRDD